MPKPKLPNQKPPQPKPKSNTQFANRPQQNFLRASAGKFSLADRAMLELQPTVITAALLRYDNGIFR